MVGASVAVSEGVAAISGVAIGLGVGLIAVLQAERSAAARRRVNNLFIKEGFTLYKGSREDYNRPCPHYRSTVWLSPEITWWSLTCGEIDLITGVFKGGKNSS
jgi:hypothetical protein